MLRKGILAWLFAWGALAGLSFEAIAQVPSNSNLTYQTPSPSYENAGAPFSDANPGQKGLLPFHPVNFEPTADPFGPAETSSYGNGPRPRIGYWASYERLAWSFSRPTTSIIGSEDPSAVGAFPGPTGATTIFINSADTGWLGSNLAWGNRWELGYVDTDNRGWMISIIEHVSQGQHLIINEGSVQFADPAGLISGFVPSIDPGQAATQFTAAIPGGNIIDADLNGNNVHGRSGVDLGRPNPLFPLPAFVPPPDGHPDSPAATDFGDRARFPITFLALEQKNVTKLNGVELMKTYRAPRLHNGGFFELLYGARYLQLDDAFSVFGTNTVETASFSSLTGALTQTVITQSGNPLADSRWDTRAINNMVGPQIGGRWSNQRGRWINSFEARFTAAANFQNVHQQTLLGNQLAFFPVISGFTSQSPFNLQSPIATSTRSFATTFAPIGEIRVQTSFVVTSNVAIKVGYTGMVMGGITRASNRIDYNGAALVSILPGHNEQLFFSNGLNFGVEVNR